MAVFAVSITKRITWRAQNQEFSNVYHYKTAPAEPFDDTAAINALEASEKACHSSTVAFIQARTWGPTDGAPSGSVTRQITDLTGTGTQPAGGDFYRELAYLVYWPLGRYGSRNRPQFLRKWLHLCYLTADSAAGYPNGTTQDTNMAVINTYITAVTSVGPGPYELCTKDGREPTGAGALYPYLEHRQLGR